MLVEETLPWAGAPVTAARAAVVACRPRAGCAVVAKAGNKHGGG